MLRKGFLGLAVVAALGLLAFPLPPYAPPEIVADVVRVIDGDTIEVQILTVPEALSSIVSVGSTERIRYIGIDAPESGTTEGELATALNVSLVRGKTVYLELDENPRDRYGRLLAYVYLDPDGYLMVNAVLATVPFIVPLPYSDTPRYTCNFEYLHNWQRICNPQCYSWTEAAEHVGETAWVYGEVKAARRLSYGRVFLNIGNPYPNTPRFTIMVEEDYIDKFDDVFGPNWEKRLVGQVVYVYGSITTYRGVPEIKPTSPSQLATEPPESCNQ